MYILIIIQSDMNSVLGPFIPLPPSLVVGGDAVMHGLLMPLCRRLELCESG